MREMVCLFILVVVLVLYISVRVWITRPNIGPVKPSITQEEYIDQWYKAQLERRDRITKHIDEINIFLDQYRGG